MDINSQEKSWSNFKKITLYISITIIAALVLMAIFLL
jgi:hypothetical protein